MKYAFACVLAVVIVSFTAGGQLVLPEFHTNIETFRVFGSEHPGPYKHPASITQLQNGDLYIAYYGGMNEYSDDTAVYGARQVKGEAGWSFPEAIAAIPFHGVGNPVIWQAPDGLVWLFFNTQYGDTWSNARVHAKISRDGARTWSDSFVLVMEEGSMVRGQPIVLMNGDYLLPLYHETGDDRERSEADTCSDFLRYNPARKEWSETNRIHSPEGNLQAQAVQINETDLFCFLRRGGGFEPTDNGWMLRASSSDGGNTWTDAERTDFPNPNSAVELIKLRNGHLMLVYNDNMNDRTPLTVTVSNDNGQTWPYRRTIAGGENTYAYPYAIQGEDEKIYLVYTTNGRTTIMLSVFQEDAITAYED